VAHDRGTEGTLRIDGFGRPAWESKDPFGNSVVLLVRAYSPGGNPRQPLTGTWTSASEVAYLGFEYQVSDECRRCSTAGCGRRAAGESCRPRPRQCERLPGGHGPVGSR
jgi:hypothetical protein